MTAVQQWTQEPQNGTLVMVNYGSLASGIQPITGLYHVVFVIMI